MLGSEDIAPAWPWMGCPVPALVATEIPVGSAFCRNPHHFAFCDPVGQFFSGHIQLLAAPCYSQESTSHGESSHQPGCSTPLQERFLTDPVHFRSSKSLAKSNISTAHSVPPSFRSLLFDSCLSVPLSKQLRTLSEYFLHFALSST